MKGSANNWMEYWNKENISDRSNFNKNMEIFIKGSTPLLNYSKNDTVLDIGCGHGYLELLLKYKVKEIYCLDVSDRYLKMCREKFKNSENVFFYKLDPSNYTSFPFFKRKKFSIIICLSVIQYYESIKDVENLIKEVKRVALPGAKFLIADIPTNTSLLADVMGVLKTGLRYGFLLDKIKHLIKMRSSEYYKIRSTKGLLILSPEVIRNLIKKLGLNAKILDIRLSTNANRKHLLIQFR